MPPTRADLELVAIHLVLLHRADWHAFDDLLKQPHAQDQMELVP